MGAGRAGYPLGVSYRYAHDPDANVLVIEFEGEISFEEEGAALRTVLAHSGLRPNARILVDRRLARMLVGPGDVPKQVSLVERNQDAFGRPRIAIVVERDLDFGLYRMFELSAEGVLDHEFRVFRKLADACSFLGLDPAELPVPSDPH